MEGDVSAFIVGCLLRGLSDFMFVKVRLFRQIGDVLCRRGCGHGLCGLVPGCCLL